MPPAPKPSSNPAQKRSCHPYGPSQPRFATALTAKEIFFSISRHFDSSLSTDSLQLTWATMKYEDRVRWITFENSAKLASKSGINPEQFLFSVIQQMMHARALVLSDSVIRHPGLDQRGARPLDASKEKGSRVLGWDEESASSRVQATPCSQSGSTTNVITTRATAEHGHTNLASYGIDSDALSKAIGNALETGNWPSFFVSLLQRQCSASCGPKIDNSLSAARKSEYICEPFRSTQRE
jgi:hypothetical protein